MQIKINFQKDHFEPGDLLQGDLLLSLTDRHHFDISGIYLQVQGFERVRFRRRTVDNTKGTTSAGAVDTDPFVDWESENNKTVNTGIPTILPISQPHFSQIVLVNLTHPITRHRAKLQRGLHSFPFAVTLPTKLPSSVNFTSGSKYSASIEYTATVQVFSKAEGSLSLTVPLRILKVNHRNNQSINSPIPFIEQSLTLSHALCFCFPSKEFDFFANWSRNAFEPGQDAQLDLRLSQPSGSGKCKLRALSVKLVRELILSVEGQTFRTVDPISKSKFRVDDGPITDLNTSTTLKIPESLKEQTCISSTISCKYFFVFEIDFKLFESVLLASEIIIL